MSTKKVRIDSVQALKKLHALGLLKEIKSPTKNHKLTKGQQSKVKKELKEMGEIVDSPKSEYKIINIKHLTRYSRKALADTGYIIKGDRVFIPMQGYDSVSIQSKIQSKGKLHPTTQVIRKTKAGKKEIEYIGTPLEKMEWRDRLMMEYQNGGFKPGEYVGVKVFDNGMFERQIHRNINTLLNYVEPDSWMKPGSDKNLLHENLHLVKISVPNHRAISSSERSTKQKRKVQYLRDKSRKLRIIKPRSKKK